MRLIASTQKAILSTLGSQVLTNAKALHLWMMSCLLMVIILLFLYSDKIGSIGVALGVAGAGVAFALQEVIVSLAG